jgi:hypothetical protein
VARSFVPLTPVHDLRRIADAVAHLRDRLVLDVVLRSDCRQLRVVLDDGQTLLVSLAQDASGQPRLDADLVRGAEEAMPGQLEVEFGRAD